MLNIIEVGKIIIGNYFFMKSMTKNYTAPVSPPINAVNETLSSLSHDKSMEHKFAVLFNIVTFEATFHINTEKFLKYNGEFTANKFFNSLHPDFIAPYLKFARSSYKFIHDNKNLFSPFSQCSRQTIPLKLKDNKYYWILQEAITMQFDEKGYLLSHLNFYSILRPMEEGENVSVLGHIYNNGFEAKEWTQIIWKDFFTSQSFELTPEQFKIVDLLKNNINLSNFEIAEQLNKTKNTIDVQNKQILARARVSYPDYEFNNIKDVVQFLIKISFF